MFERRMNPDGIRESIRNQNYAIDGNTQAVAIELLEDMAKEYERCYAEIERQQALIERAKVFVKECNLESSEDRRIQAREWLEDFDKFQKLGD